MCVVADRKESPAQQVRTETDWNDVLRQKGILPPKPKEAEIAEEQIENLMDSVVKEYTSTGNLFLLTNSSKF